MDDMEDEEFDEVDPFSLTPPLAHAAPLPWRLCLRSISATRAARLIAFTAAVSDAQVLEAVLDERELHTARQLHTARTHLHTARQLHTARTHRSDAAAAAQATDAPGGHTAAPAHASLSPDHEAQLTGLYKEASE